MRISNTLPTLIAGMLCVVMARSAAGGPEPVVHRDAARGFRLELESGWRVLPPGAAQRVDRAASVVAGPAHGEGFLAVEARRLPRVALTVWAAAWDSHGRPGNALAGNPGLGSRYLRVQSFTTRRVPAGNFVVVSEFRRSGGWAYRISRYLPFQAEDTVRDRLDRAAAGFRVLPGKSSSPQPAPVSGETTSLRVLPDGAIIRDGIWCRVDLAAAMRLPVGWRFMVGKNRASFLPRILHAAMLDPINGYQAGLLRLGEAIRLEDLAVRMQAAFAIHLADATGFARVRRADAVRVTCTSRVPKGAEPKDLPLTWLAEGRIVEGQGLAIVVGVTGLGLATDHRRMERAFEAWRTPPVSFFPGRTVRLEDGFVFAPQQGFRWRLPATWTIDADGAALGFREDGALLSARRRGPGPGGSRLPPVRARVHRGIRTMESGPGSSPRSWPPTAELTLLGGGRIVSRHRLPSPGGNARSDSAILLESAEGREWVRCTEIRLPDRAHVLRLVSCVPMIARERLTAEQEALHRNFGPVPAGTITHGALQIDDGALTDTLRGLRVCARPGWIWLLGRHARAIDATARVALMRDRGEARFTVIAERIPGFSVMRWAAYQRVKQPKRLRDGRLFREESVVDGRRKSILQTHDGWCLRVDLALVDDAPSRSSAEGHWMLRSFATHRATADHPPPDVQPDPIDLPPGQSLANGMWRREGCPAALAVPPGWRMVPPRMIGSDFPLSVHAAFEERDFGAFAALVEADGPDPEVAAARLERRLERHLTAWRVEKPARRTPRGWEFDAQARIPGAWPGSSLPAHWRARVTRVGARVFAIVVWIRGAPRKPDRKVLQAALDALIPAASGASPTR